MSRGSLNDAVRAAGYAMATSEEMLGIPSQTTLIAKAAESDRDRSRETPQTVVATQKPAESRSLRTFFGSFAVWA